MRAAPNLLPELGHLAYCGVWCCSQSIILFRTSFSAASLFTDFEGLQPPLIVLDVEGGGGKGMKCWSD